MCARVVHATCRARLNVLRSTQLQIIHSSTIAEVHWNDCTNKMRICSIAVLLSQQFKINKIDFSLPCRSFAARFDHSTRSNRKLSNCVRLTEFKWCIYMSIVHLWCTRNWPDGNQHHFRELINKWSVSMVQLNFNEIETAFIKDFRKSSDTTMEWLPLAFDKWRWTKCGEASE